MEVALRLQLSPLMSDKDSDKILNKIKEGKLQKEQIHEKVKKVIEKIESEFETIFSLSYSGRKEKIIKVNQLLLQNNKAGVKEIF